MAIDYEDFEVLFEPIEGRHFKTSFRSHEVGEFDSTFEIPALDMAHPETPAARTESRDVQVLGPKVQHSASAKAYGEALFEALFKDSEIREAFKTRYRFTQNNKHFLGLRLILITSPDDPLNAQLQGLSWEYLHWDGSFGAIGALSIVRRYKLSKPIGKLAFERPLRILLVAQHADDLEIEEELKKVDRVLRGTKARLVTERLVNPTLDHLRQKLGLFKADILHFMGHGGIDSEAGGGLYFAPQRSESRLVLGKAFAQKIMTAHLKMVFLNACHSGGARSIRGAQAAPSSSESSVAGFRNVASELMREGCPAVIAMQSAIRDSAAITFSESVYQHLAQGHPLDSAVSKGRRALNEAGNDSYSEWAIPVLLMRTAETQAPMGWGSVVPKSLEGRRDEIDELFLEARANHLVIVIHAPVGTGKSTLLAEGVKPILDNNSCATAMIDTYDLPVDSHDHQTAQGLITRELDVSLQEVGFNLSEYRKKGASSNQTQTLEEFCEGLGEIRLKTGVPPVIILDHIEELFGQSEYGVDGHFGTPYGDGRSGRTSHRPRVVESTSNRSKPYTDFIDELALLITATVGQGLDADDIFCRWVLVARDRDLGMLGRWLFGTVDRPEVAKKTSLLPLGDFQRWYTQWRLPILGLEKGVGTGEKVLQGVVAALASQEGLKLDDLETHRIAEAFVAAQRSEWNNPLITNLRVYMEKRARDPNPSRLPPRDNLGDEIRSVLEGHVAEALVEMAGLADEKTQLRRRNYTLLALRLIAEAGPEGYDIESLEALLGSSGAKILGALAGKDAATGGLGAIEPKLIKKALTSQYILEHRRYREVILNLSLQAPSSNAPKDVKSKFNEHLFVDKRKINSLWSEGQTTDINYSFIERVGVASRLIEPRQREWWAKCWAEHRRRKMRELFFSLSTKGALFLGLLVLAVILVGTHLLNRNSLRELRDRNENAIQAAHELRQWYRRAPFVAISDQTILEHIGESSSQGTRLPTYLFQHATKRPAQEALSFVDLLIEGSRDGWITNPIDVIGGSAWVLDSIEEADSDSDAAEQLRKRLIETQGNNHEDSVEWLSVKKKDRYLDLNCSVGNLLDIGRKDDGVFNLSSNFPGFEVLKHPVSQSDFEDFRENILKGGRSTPNDEETEAVAAGVSWFEAYAYATWVGGRLPSAEQWLWMTRETRKCVLVTKSRQPSCWGSSTTDDASIHAAFSEIGEWTRTWITGDKGPMLLGRTEGSQNSDALCDYIPGAPNSTFAELRLIRPAQ